MTEKMFEQIKLYEEFLKKIARHKGVFEIRYNLVKAKYFDDVDSMLKDVMSELIKDDKKQVYMGIFEREFKQRKASDAKNIKGTRFYVIDLDFKDPNWQNDSDKVKMVNTLKDYLKPALIVDSGRGAHFYVVFNEYVDKDMWDKDAWKYYLERISRDTNIPIEDVRKGQAWGLDPAVSDLVRVVRIPNSYNEKAEKVCQIIYNDYYNYNTIDYVSQVLKPYIDKKTQEEIEKKKERELKKAKREIKKELKKEKEIKDTYLRFTADLEEIFKRLEDEIDFIEILKEDGVDYKEYTDRVHFFSPWRDDGRNPDFVIYKHRPYWGYDFKLQESFSPYRYLVEIKGYSPKEAILELLERANLLDEYVEEVEKKKKKRDKVEDIFKNAEEEEEKIPKGLKQLEEIRKYEGEEKFFEALNKYYKHKLEKSIQGLDEYLLAYIEPYILRFPQKIDPEIREEYERQLKKADVFRFKNEINYLFPFNMRLATFHLFKDLTAYAYFMNIKDRKERFLKILDEIYKFNEFKYTLGKKAVDIAKYAPYSFKLLHFIACSVYHLPNISVISTPPAFVRDSGRYKREFLTNIFIPIAKYLKRDGKKKYLFAEIKDIKELELVFKFLIKEAELDDLIENEINLFTWEEGQEVNKNTLGLSSPFENLRNKFLADLLISLIFAFETYKLLDQKYLADKLGKVEFRKKVFFAHPNSKYKDLFLDIDEEILTDHTNPNFNIYTENEANEYLEIYKHLKNSEKAIAIQLLGLNALIANLFEKENYVVHLWGTSGAGKTFLLRLIKSFVGNPENIPSLNATLNAMEKAIAEEPEIHVRDEFELGNDVDIANLIYTFTQGRGRARLTKTLHFRKVHKFSGALFTAGEKSLDNVIERLKDKGSTTKRGALRRTIQIHVDDKTFDKNFFVKAQDVRNKIEEYFGFGVFFVEEFMKYMDKYSKERFTAFYELFKYLFNKAELDRHSGVFSTTVLTSLIFEKIYNSFDKEELDFDKIRQEILKIAFETRGQVNYAKNEMFYLYKDLLDYFYNSKETYIDFADTFSQVPDTKPQAKLFILDPSYADYLRREREISREKINNVALAVTDKALEEFCKEKGYDIKIVKSILKRANRYFDKNGNKYNVNVYYYDRAEQDKVKTKIRANILILPYQIIDKNKLEEENRVLDEFEVKDPVTGEMKEVKVTDAEDIDDLGDGYYYTSTNLEYEDFVFDYILKNEDEEENYVNWDVVLDFFVHFARELLELNIEDIWFNEKEKKIAFYKIFIKLLETLKGKRQKISPFVEEKLKDIIDKVDREKLEEEVEYAWTERLYNKDYPSVDDILTMPIEFYINNKLYRLAFIEGLMLTTRLIRDEDITFLKERFQV